MQFSIHSSSVRDSLSLYEYKPRSQHSTIYAPIYLPVYAIARHFSAPRLHNKMLLAYSALHYTMEPHGTSDDMSKRPPTERPHIRVCCLHNDDVIWEEKKAGERFVKRIQALHI